jgi:hypothetical protein
MRKFTVLACTVGQTVLLAAAISFIPAAPASAKECQSPPKSARGKCLKAAYNLCNTSNGKWWYPAGVPDPCPGTK